MLVLLLRSNTHNTLRSRGLSIKLGEGLQATFGGLGGLVVALYFSWQITVSIYNSRLQE
jgi:hypothetical protein